MSERSDVRVESWMGAVFIPLIVAGVGWLGVEFNGGIEGRQQRRVLNYLQIAGELGDTPEGRGAHRVAEAETAQLLEERGTKAQLVAAVLGWMLCLVIVVLCIVIIIFVALTGEYLDRWTSVVAGSGLAAVYSFAAYQCWANIKRVHARRREQRPSSLVLASDLQRVESTVDHG